MAFDLLLGGVRSGKSRLAVRLGEASGRPVTVIATATEIDDEMTDRIAAHRSERPDHWTTIEEPCDLAGAVRRVPPGAFVVVDCLTVWTSNMMLAEASTDEVLDHAAEAAALLAIHPNGAVVVSNEVGMGVHPSSELGRRYRDLLGGVNVRFGAVADRVALVMAGRVLDLDRVEDWAR